MANRGGRGSGADGGRFAACAGGRALNWKRVKLHAASDWFLVNFACMPFGKGLRVEA